MIAGIVCAEEAQIQPRGQLDGLLEVPGRFLGMFGGNNNNGNGYNNNGGRGQGNSGNVGQGNGGRGQRGEGQNDGQNGRPINNQNTGNDGQESGQGSEQSLPEEQSQSCRTAAAKCNSNILCGTALRKRFAVCQFSLLPKSCFKCQAATSVLTSTPEGRAYMQCECGMFDLPCKARKRLAQNCVGGQ